jgi:hypothetical protein
VAAVFSGGRQPDRELAETLRGVVREQEIVVFRVGLMGGAQV